MPTPEELELIRKQNPGLNMEAIWKQPTSSRIQTEDNKNMAIASSLIGQGGQPPVYRDIALERFKPAGEVPYGVSIPGIPAGTVPTAIPSSYDMFESEITKAIKTPAPTIEGVGAIERALTTTTPYGGLSPYSGIVEKATSRLSTIMDRLASPLRKSTRAALTTEAGHILNFLEALSGQEMQRRTKAAELTEERARRAIQGATALAGLRREEREAAMMPWDIAGKLAEIQRTGAMTKYYGEEAAKTAGEVALQPTTVEEAIRRERAIKAPFETPEKPTRAIDLWTILMRTEAAKAAADPRYTPKDEITLWKQAQQLAKTAKKPTKEEFRAKAKKLNPEYSDEEIDAYYDATYGE